MEAAASLRRAVRRMGNSLSELYFPFPAAKARRLTAEGKLDYLLHAHPKSGKERRAIVKHARLLRLEIDNLKVAEVRALKRQKRVRQFHALFSTAVLGYMLYELQQRDEPHD